MSSKSFKPYIFLGTMLIILFLYSCGKDEKGTSVTVDYVGNVEGSVTDSSTGATLSGVTIQIGDTTGVSGNNGVYSIQNLNAGAWTVTASRTGYQNYNGHCDVVMGSTITFDIHLTLIVAPDTTPPTVSSTSPASNSSNVAVNSAINATFSEALDVSTITTATFSLKQGSTSVPGTVTFSGTTATFTPSSNLLYNTAYSATITTAVKDTAGNIMITDYTWSFTTGTAPDTTPPTVSLTSPDNFATGAAVNSAINATFSEAMDVSTITTSTFTLKQGSANIAGTVTYSGTAATFTPSSSLSYNTTYSATISREVKDTAGNAMATDYTWSFTTKEMVVPYIIIGRSTTITSINNDTAYKYPMNVLVSDGNGNAISGAQVTLSVWPVNFIVGYSDGYQILSDLYTYPNEDTNKNLVLDPGEDSNSDGKLTPPFDTTGTLPPTVTTDANGFASFDYIYLKQYAAWLTVRISASVIIDTEANNFTDFMLPWSLDDATAGNLTSSPFCDGIYKLCN